MLKDQRTADFPPNFDPEQARAAMEAGTVEDSFWEKHYAAYLKRYPEQFVAVKDGEVVATNPDLYELVRLLESKGLSPTETWIQFLTADPYLILP